MTPIRWTLVASAAVVLGCSTPTLESRHETAASAITELRQGSFDRAGQLAGEQLATDASNPYARIVRAIVRYKKVNQQLALDGRTIVVGGLEAGAVNQKYLRTTFGDAESELASVEADLAVAAKQRGISMDLCLACWEVDWNGDGNIDDRDRHLLEIEQDEAGNSIPEGDPRRRPTFRFDDGDVAWARAFVSFERAALDVLLAYDWAAAGDLARARRHRPSRIVVHLVEPNRIAQAKDRMLEGLSQSDAARRAYLAETDDDREWVPNPRQRSHPMPLPVDQALYDTWEGVVGDVRRLVQGEEGLRVADLLALGWKHPSKPPRGYLDVGRMLAKPKDIVIDLTTLEHVVRDDDDEALLSAVFGEYYVREMKPSPLPHRLERMKREIERQDEAFDRKLRYLFWLN